jgi:hypothetical protein
MTVDFYRRHLPSAAAQPSRSDVRRDPPNSQAARSLRRRHHSHSVKPV